MPRRSKGRVERHGERWRLQVDLNGTRHRESFATRMEAEHALVQLLEETRRHEEIRSARAAAILSVGDVVHEYYERHKRSIELSTQATYEQLLDCYVSRIADRNARVLTESPSEIQDFYDSLPPVAAQRVHAILRPAFQHAVDHRFLDRNPCDIASPGRARIEERAIPNELEVQKLVLSAEEADRALGLFVRISATLGTRRGETCALRWEDFDPPLVHIRRNIARVKGGTIVRAPKAGEGRTLLMGDAFFDALEPVRREKGWVFLGKGPRQPDRANGSDELVLRLLRGKSGTFACPDGGVGTRLAELLGATAQSGSALIKRIEERGLVTVERGPRRTFAITITDDGRGILELPPVFYPPHPDTMGHRFEYLAARAGLPFTLHSLRHFVATTLYNRTRDWVQLAKFLGHRTPAITMKLYANHVIEDSQVVLGDAAAALVPASL